MGEWSRRAYRREGTRMAVMTRRQRRWFAALGGSVVVGTLFAWLPLQAAAADLRQGPRVTVGTGQTINDDIYAAGGTISIDGHVNGSVIAAGGSAATCVAASTTCASTAPRSVATSTTPVITRWC